MAADEPFRQYYKAALRAADKQSDTSAPATRAAARAAGGTGAAQQRDMARPAESAAGAATMVVNASRPPFAATGTVTAPADLG